jgi:hypothetical protein
MILSQMILSKNDSVIQSCRARIACNLFNKAPIMTHNHSYPFTALTRRQSRISVCVAVMASLLPLCAGGDPPPADDYSVWRQAQFPAAFGNPAMEASVWGDHADPDGDGCCNLLEFVMCRNPNVSDTHLGPQCRIDGGDVVVTYRETTAANPGVTWHGEWSVDAGFWMDAGVLYQTVETHSGYRVIEARVSMNREQKILMRLSARR